MKKFIEEESESKKVYIVFKKIHCACFGVSLVTFQP